MKVLIIISVALLVLAAICRIVDSVTPNRIAAPLAYLGLACLAAAHWPGLHP